MGFFGDLFGLKRQPLTLSSGPAASAARVPLEAREPVRGGLVKPAPAHHDASWWGPRTVGSSRRGVGLTPQRLARYLRQASDGYVVEQAELLGEMLDRDLHLVAVLNTRTMGVGQLPWRVVPGGRTRRDQRIAEWVTDLIQGVEGWREALSDLLDGIYFGYSAAEIDWEVRGGQVRVRRLVGRPATWLVPQREDPMRWAIRTPEAPTRGEPLQPGAWVLHQPRAKCGLHAARRGLGRPLGWAYLFKNYTLKDWLIFAETYGCPIRVGKYDATTSQDDRAQLLAALRSLGADAAAMIPTHTDIEFVQAASTRSSVEVYEKLVTWADRAQSKAVLGQTLTTEEGRRGTQALGNVHDNVRHDLLESDAAQLSDTLTRDLVRVAVRHQFGEQHRYPRLVLDATPPEDRAAVAKMYVDLHGIGVALPRQHVHERFGIPLPEEGEEVYQGGQDAQEPPKPRVKSAAEQRRDARWAEARELREAVHVCGAHELAETPHLRADLEVAVRKALAEHSAGGWQRVLEHLDEHLVAAGSISGVGPALVEALRTLELEDLAEELADEMLTAELIGRVQVLEDEEALGEWPDVPPREALDWWRERIPTLTEELPGLTAEARHRAFAGVHFTTLRAAQGVHYALEMALEDGDTFAEFEDRYREEWRLSGLSGGAGTRPWYIELVFRNHMATAYQVGRYREMTRPAMLEARPFWLYDAIIDERTRNQHEAMNGKAWRAGHAIWLTWYPPNGHGCRCGVRALTQAELVRRGLSVEEALPSWPSRDGGLAEPMLPDHGWRANPALSPHEVDWAQFPDAWTEALGVKETR
jgi:SPP1 gp7 family putative phage head morphogenesis protein